MGVKEIEARLESILEFLEDSLEDSPDWSKWDERDVEDTKALLEVVAAVRAMPAEPATIDTKGRMVCIYCWADLGMRGHRDSCPWLKVGQALARLEGEHGVG